MEYFYVIRSSEGYVTYEYPFNPEDLIWSSGSYTIFDSKEEALKIIEELKHKASDLRLGRISKNAVLSHQPNPKIEYQMDAE